MKNQIDQTESCYRKITPAQRLELIRCFPDIFTAELDDAVYWNDDSVAETIHEEWRGGTADTIVETDLGLRCLHVFFLRGVIQASADC